MPSLSGRPLANIQVVDGMRFSLRLEYYYFLVPMACLAAQRLF